MLQQIKWYLLTRPERQWLGNTKNKNQKPKNKFLNEPFRLDQLMLIEVILCATDTHYIDCTLLNERADPCPFFKNVYKNLTRYLSE